MFVTPVSLKTSRYGAPMFFFLAFALTAIFAFAPFEAMAQTPSTLGTVMCTVMAVLYGNFGRAMACVAVSTLGVQAMLGRISWNAGIIIAIGICVFFAAPALVGIVLVASNDPMGGAIGC